MWLAVSKAVHGSAEYPHLSGDKFWELRVSPQTNSDCNYQALGTSNPESSKMEVVENSGKLDMPGLLFPLLHEI